MLPPLGELLGACGFEVRGGFVAPGGTDWDAFGRVREAAAMAVYHGLDPEGAHALIALNEMYRLFTDGKVQFDAADDGVAGELAGLIGDDDLGPAFVDLVGETRGYDSLRRFADALRERSPRRHRAGPAWLSSVAAARTGDHEHAEAMLREALDADDEHWPSLESAAWYANDRGDARRAVSLLDQLAEMGDDEAADRAEFLLPYTRTTRALVRRNDLCPCGSGRKYKHCCLGTTGALPLPDRVGWLWEKLAWFLSQAGYDDDMEALLDELGADEPGDELLAASLVLFEDRVVDHFLRLRGPVLPDDERNLVTQWALVDRSVHEVVTVVRGEGVVLARPAHRRGRRRPGTARFDAARGRGRGVRPCGSRRFRPPDRGRGHVGATAAAGPASGRSRRQSRSGATGGAAGRRLGPPGATHHGGRGGGVVRGPLPGRRSRCPRRPRRRAGS